MSEQTLDDLVKFLDENPDAEVKVGYAVWDMVHKITCKKLGPDVFTGHKFSTSPELYDNEIVCILPPPFVMRIDPEDLLEKALKGPDDSAPPRCFASVKKFHVDDPRRCLWIYTRRSGRRGVYFNGGEDDGEGPAYTLEQMETGKIDRGHPQLDFDVVEISGAELLLELESWPMGQRNAVGVLKRHGWEESEWQTPTIEETEEWIRDGDPKEGL